MTCTIFKTRLCRSGCPCGKSARCETFAEVNSMADPFGQAAAQAHILAFGAIRNQNNVVPGVVLASAVTSTAEAFLRIATEVRNNQFHPGMLEYGMEDGMVKVVLNPKLESRIPEAAMKRFLAVERTLSHKER